MDILIQKAFRLLQKLAGDDHRSGGAVPDLIILGFGHLHYHLGHRMLYIHLSEDGGAVIGDGRLFPGNEHLIHALGTEGGPDGLGNRLRRQDVLPLRIFSALSFAAFF